MHEVVDPATILVSPKKKPSDLPKMFQPKCVGISNKPRGFGLCLDLHQNRSQAQKSTSSQLYDILWACQYLKKCLKKLGWKEICMVHILTSIDSDQYCFSSIHLAVGRNVSTKVFICTPEKGIQWVNIFLKAAIYLELNLLVNRSEEGESLKQPFQTPDMSVCAFSGNGSNKLMHCSQCKKSKNCTAICQQNHYFMPGLFAQKGICKNVASNVMNNS
jgi:hypothetical protein